MLHTLILILWCSGMGFMGQMISDSLFGSQNITNCKWFGNIAITTAISLISLWMGNSNIDFLKG